MSWHYLQEGEAAFSLPSYLDSIPDAQLRYGETQGSCCFSDSEIGRSTDSRYGMMFQHLMASHGEERSTLSQEGSHARILAQQERGQELPEIVAVFGLSIQGSLEKLDLILSSRKTPRYSELEALMSSCATLPRWGMTLDGACWELGTSAKFISGIGCGYLPTPSGVNGGANKNHIAGRLDEWGGSSNPFRKTEIGRVHCPRFEEWMMGWPETWAALTGFEMDKFQSWQLQHSEFYPQD